MKGHNKRPNRIDVTQLPTQSDVVDNTNGPTPVKAARMGGVHDPHDPHSSDHVVAVTQLKEKIALLQKQISQKDGQLLTKDKMVKKILKNRRVLCVFERSLTKITSYLRSRNWKLNILRTRRNFVRRWKRRRKSTRLK